MNYFAARHFAAWHFRTWQFQVVVGEPRATWSCSLVQMTGIWLDAGNGGTWQDTKATGQWTGAN